MNIQQGNVVTQDMVNQLKPGMDQQQVQFIMGTPLVTDTFHAERWDYIYTFQRGGGKEVERQWVSLYFDAQRLQRVEGDMRPMPEGTQSPPPPKMTTVDVPPQDNRGLILRAWDAITGGDESYY